MKEKMNWFSNIHCCSVLDEKRSWVDRHLSDHPNLTFHQNCWSKLATKTMQNNGDHATHIFTSYFSSLIGMKIIAKAFIMVSEVCFFAEFLHCLALIRLTLTMFVRSDVNDTLITVTVNFTVTAEYNFFDLEIWRIHDWCLRLVSIYLLRWLRFVVLARILLAHHRLFHPRTLDPPDQVAGGKGWTHRLALVVHVYYDRCQTASFRRRGIQYFM